MSIGRDPLCEKNGLVRKVLQIITIILIYCCAYILSMPNCCELLCCHDISSWPRIEHYMKDLRWCTAVDVGLGFLIYMLAILYSLLCLFFYCFLSLKNISSVLCVVSCFDIYIYFNSTEESR